jgi:PIN like domain
MKDLFIGYYRPMDEEFEELWKKCVFVLDTNVILNLYRYDEATRDDLLNTLRKVEDRLWIPHQVALEYQERRIQVIKEQEKKLENIQAALNKLKNDALDFFVNLPSIPHENLIKNLDEIFNNFIEEIRPLTSKQLRSNEFDYIREQIDSIFRGKIGDPPNSQQELEDIYKEGEARYKIKYPPGFKDENKKQEQKEQKEQKNQKEQKESPYLYNMMVFKKEYGDLIIWKQLLKEVQAKEWKYVIFITHDKKEDWWRIEKGETIGPRPELVEETYKAGASSFYMYTPDRFLQFAKKYLEINVKDDSISQVKNLTELKDEEKVQNEPSLSSHTLMDHLCPECGKKGFLLIHEGLVAGRPGYIYRFHCSSCGHKSFAAQAE